MRFRLLFTIAATALTPAMVTASETTTLIYDAKGRLVIRDTRGGPQSGLLDTYTLDHADNRVNTTMSGAYLIDHVSPNTPLYPGQAVMSADQRFLLTFQSDGNLALYDQHHQLMWSAGVAGQGGTVLWMQGDGNLVIYNAAGQGVWSTATYGNNGADLAVQTDGNVVIYTTNGTPIWGTGTCCH